MQGFGGNFADKGIGIIAFGTVAGGAGAALTGGNFWQGAVTGLVVSGLNHFAHLEANSDRGYDKNGNQINNNGGETTDYMYDDNGKIINTVSVKTYGSNLGFTNLDGTSPKLTMRSFGMKSYTSTGAITEDNTFFEIYTGGKLIGKGFSYLGEGFNTVKVPLFRSIGQSIKTYAPILGANRYLRIGTSTSRGNEVFRITWGNNTKHFLDINLGKIPKIK